MTLYATKDAVRARVDATYAAYDLITDDDLLDSAILKASELIDEHTLNRAQIAYDSEDGVDPDPTPYRDALSNAVSDQVEFWAEAGTEHDVVGLKGSVVAGRFQLHPTATVLAPRAKRTLMNNALYYAGAAIG